MQIKITVRHYTDGGLGRPIGRFEILRKQGNEDFKTSLLTANDDVSSARLVEDTLVELGVLGKCAYGLASVLPRINPGVVTFTINS